MIQLPECSWETLTSVWYDATAQLLADGVPNGRFFPAGVVNIMSRWHYERHKFKTMSDWQSLASLPLRRYNPALDRGGIEMEISPLNVGKQALESAEGTISTLDVLEEIDMSDSSWASSDDDTYSSDAEEYHNGRHVPYIWPSDASRYQFYSDIYPQLPRIPSRKDTLEEEGRATSALVIDGRKASVTI